MNPTYNLENEGTLPVNSSELDGLLDEAFSELDISSQEPTKGNSSKSMSYEQEQILCHQAVLQKQLDSMATALGDRELAKSILGPAHRILASQFAESSRSKEPSIWSAPFHQQNTQIKANYNDPDFWIKMSQDIQGKVELNTSDIPEPLKFLQATFESTKTDGPKYEHHTNTHEPKTADPQEEGNIDPLIGVPRYSTLSKLIEGKPPGFEEQMVPLLHALNHSTEIPIPSFLFYNPGFEENIKINNVPLIADLIGKYGYELAVGFGKLAIKNIFRTVPGIGIAITICEVYSIYNRLMSSTMSAPVHIGPRDINKDVPNTEEEITLSSLSDDDLVQKIIDLSDDVPIPILIGDFPTHIIGVYRDGFGMTPRVCMLSRAESAVTYDMCPSFKHYSNKELAQKLVDIACGVEIHPAFINRLPHILGTYKHTHLKQVNELYSALCSDYRFESELYYRNGNLLKIEGELPGFSKDSVRVDLRTIEPISTSPNGYEIREVYDLKTGFQGITFKQIENYKRHLPGDVIYEVRPNWDKPYQVYPVDERRITSIK